MRSLNLIGIITISVLLAAAAFAEDPHREATLPAGSKLSRDDLFDIYYDFIEKIKPYGLPADRKEHEKTVNPAVRGWGGGAVFTMVDYYVTLGTEDIRVTVNGDTGEIRAYSLDLVIEYGPIKVKDKYALPKLPAKLTASKIKEIAKSYLYLNTEMALKEYKLTVTYGGNVWDMKFERQLAGVVFERDAIYMTYSEKYGLLSYRNRLFSDECDIRAKKTKEDALTVADKYCAEVKKKLKIKPARAYDGDAKLLIINPALLRQEVDGRSVPLAQLRKTRLAWQLCYVGHSEWAARMRNVIVVYIDAITGEPLCHIPYIPMN